MLNVYIIISAVIKLNAAKSNDVYDIILILRITLLGTVQKTLKMKDWNMRFQTLWVVKRQDQLGAMASPAPVIVQSCVPFVTKFAFSMAPLYTRKASSTSTRVG